MTATPLVRGYGSTVPVAGAVEQFDGKTCVISMSNYRLHNAITSAGSSIVQTDFPIAHKPGYDTYSFAVALGNVPIPCILCVSAAGKLAIMATSPVPEGAFIRGEIVYPVAGGGS